MWAWKNKWLFFISVSTGDGVVRYSCLDFFSSAIWWYFQLFGQWSIYLTYQIRCTATYIYVEIHKMRNFPSICSGDWHICAEYDLGGRRTLKEALSLMGTRTPTIRCLITRPEYHLWEHLSLSEWNWNKKNSCLFFQAHTYLFRRRNESCWE